MPEVFDPYYQWLGIPSQEQPPHYYRLLGVPLFEKDPQVISNAADRQMTFLRTLQNGPHSAESQKLLNEVSTARTVLLNAEKKTGYDAKLRAIADPFGASARPSVPSGPQPSISPTATPTAPANPFVATASLRPGAAVEPAMEELPGLPALPLSPTGGVGVVIAARRKPRPPSGLGTIIAIVIGGVVGIGGAILLLPFITGKGNTPNVAGASPAASSPAVARVEPSSPDRPAGLEPVRGRDVPTGESSTEATTQQTRLEPMQEPAPEGPSKQAFQPAPASFSTPVISGEWMLHANGWLSTSGQPWGRYAFIFGDAAWRDYDLSVDVLEEPDVAPGREHLDSRMPMEAGVIVRADASGRSFWRAAVGCQHQAKRIAVFPVIDGIEDPKGGGQMESNRFSHHVNAWYTVTIQARGDRIRVQVDGDLVGDFENPRLSFGRVGLTTYNEGRTYWRNLEVRDPSGAVLQQGWPRASFYQPAAAKVVPAAQGPSQRLRVVAANPDWQGHVQVAAGSKITVLATGRWSHGFGECDADGAIHDGGIPTGQLSARLAGWTWNVGKKSTFFARESGELQFRMFDAENLKHYEDNKGEIEVAVVVEAPKPSPGQPSPDETARTTNYLTPPQAPVPSDEELAVAKESFDKLYGREWRGAEDPKAKAALAHRLIVAGAGTFDAPALRYCLFDAARRAAAESAAPAAFLSAMQRQWDEFAAPRWPLVVETLELAGTSAKANDVRAGLARLCRSLAAEALAESQADAALELAMLGGQLAAKSRDVPLLKRLQEFQGQTTAWIERSTAAEAARTTLRGKPDETTSDETSPETAAAHRTLGVWLCLFEEDWGEGRPHLLKCDDRALRELAEREQSPPAEAAGAVDLANAWLSLSETASPAEKPYFRLRAHRWYFAASGQATGAAAKTCEEKLTELESGLPLQVRRRFRNSLGTTFIWCPPGEFRKGSPALEPQREIVDGASRERPHRVRLTKGFWLAQYETTQAEYFAVMGNNPSAFSATGSLAGRPEALYAARFPVESIRYAEAFEFCRRLKFSEGRSYRLPTDAEWEYACRAGASTPFAWGPAHNGRLANQNGAHPYETNEKGPNLNRPTVVGHYPANLWGFHDMHGNVWEWCSDPFQNAPPGADLEIDPLGPEISEDRLHRGGAWDGDCHLGRSATRHGVQKSYRGPGVGFRVALDAE